MCVWVDGSNGSGTSEDLFWKLDALQTFIRDLHWPEEEFAKHLESRIKLMSSNMIENCVKRTRMAFESKLAKSSKSTDFRISPSLCTMFNVMVDAKDQSAKLCAMELGQEKPGMDVADGYVTFMRHSQDMLREKVNEEVYIERLFDVKRRLLRCVEALWVDTFLCEATQIIFLCTSSSMTLLLRALPHLHIEQPSLARTLLPCEVCMHCTLNSTVKWTGICT
ncbi:hypothetical protein XENOCAPTIV_020109 [Xenoophorus captivus]|uniref:MHD1 domain-containing protein n=1 Tax=Xenoophorus captivus TaxID=1517983 RepID=A0ABV0QMB5_9TELE